MGYEFPLSVSPSATSARSNCCDSDTGDESNNDRASLSPEASLPPRSTSIGAGSSLQGLSQQGLVDAFHSASFSAPQIVSLREWLRLGKRKELTAQIFWHERFVQAWGYADLAEAKTLIGCVDNSGQVDQVAKALYRPVRRWALDGYIDKQQFFDLKTSCDFESYLNLFANGYLTEEQLAKIAVLYCYRKELGFDYGSCCFGLSGIFVAYSRGMLSFEETEKLTRPGVERRQYMAKIVPKLFASGALSKGWEPYASELVGNIAYMSKALGGFYDPIVWSLCNARGSAWDKDVARRYFGVDDLSKVIVTQADVERADHEGNLPGTGSYLGRPVTAVLGGNCSVHLMIAAEVRRRLERERAASAMTEMESPIGPARGTALAREIKKACVLF